jgi:hypothetical protein
MRVRCLVVLVALALSPSAAGADDGEEDSLFVAAGPLLGAAIHDGPNGLLVGGELSLGWIHFGHNDTDKPFWLGAYTDVLYDTGTDTGRVSVGPELGYLMLGFDGGLVRELGDTERWGFAGRGSISIPVTWKEPTKHPRLTTVTTVSFYFRAVTWRDEPAAHTELGVLVKWVLPALVRW